MAVSCGITYISLSGDKQSTSFTPYLLALLPVVHWRTCSDFGSMRKAGLSRETLLLVSCEAVTTFEIPGNELICGCS